MPWQHPRHRMLSVTHPPLPLLWLLLLLLLNLEQLLGKKGASPLFSRSILLPLVFG